MGNFCRWFAFIIAVVAAGCTLTDSTPPPLQGPSELGLSLTLFANPDVLSQDGASQSQIVIEARDAYGQLLPNTPVRVEIVYQGTPVDFGTLSSRSVVTGSNGRATVTYTAPTIVGGAAAGTINIVVTPTGNNAANAIGRVVDIRLVPPGVIVAGGPTPHFTFSPSSPRAFEDVFFVSDSTPAPATDLTSFAWNFGDGSTASGPSVTHRFASGTYFVQLTVTDTNGLSATFVQSVAVSPGNVPTAAFTISPTTGNTTNQPIFFNASSSTPGAGRRIVRYDWDFGSGATGSGVSVSKSYDTAGTYNVTLTVTDDVGQTDQFTNTVNVAAPTPIVVITTSPSSPNPGTVVNFNSNGTTYSPGSGPSTFSWTFGDGFSCSTAVPAGCGLGTPANPTHAYALVGSYSAQLSVTDTSGRTGVGNATVTVAAVTPPTPPAPPVAAFTFSPPNPDVSDLTNTVSFDAATSTTPSGAPISNYRWNFGDGVIITGAGTTPAPPPGGTMLAPRHTYVAGTYTVTLIVTDTNGLTGSTALTVTVTP